MIASICCFSYFNNNNTRFNSIWNEKPKEISDEKKSKCDLQRKKSSFFYFILVFKKFGHFDMYMHIFSTSVKKITTEVQKPANMIQ